MGKKYIIELEDKPFHNGNGDFLYRVKGFNSLVFDMTGVGKLTPYTEPDTEKVREEAFKNGYDAACKDIDIKSKTNAAYQKGLEDAWECARKIVDCAIPYLVLENYLEIGECTADVIKHLPASKAIEVVRQYEQEKEEIKVGDEVKAFEKKPFIVTGFVYGCDGKDVYCHGFVTENGISTGAKKNNCERTGRHFPELVEVLKKARDK